jgi:alkylhydroperoxidase family enzyme
VWGESTLPPRDRALLALRTLWLTRSHYLWAHRAAAARRAGVTDAELERIARGPDTAGWDHFEAALLRAADELIVDAFVSDATWATLTSRYDTNQMIDAVDTVGALTMHAGAASSLGVQLEPNVDERLPAGIPYAVAAAPTGVRLIDREARIAPVAAEDGAGGNAPNVFRTFTRNPPADRVRGAVNGYLNNNERITLQPRHRELLMIRIGVLCRSEYEYAAHVRVGRRLGMTDADNDRILAGPGRGGDPVEDALLQATDELHRDVVVSGQTWGTLAAALDTQQLLDALMTVGAYRSGSMLISSAGVQLDSNMADFRFPPSLR